MAMATVMSFLHSFFTIYLLQVTGVMLVLAIGLSVDANVHIAHFFLQAQGTRNERAAAALLVR